MDLSLVNANSRSYDRAASSLDIRHIANISYLWTISEFGSLGRAGRKLLGGWSLDGLARIQSGNTFNVVAGTDTNLDGNSNDRPNVSGNPALDSGRSGDEQRAQYFNTSVFTRPLVGTFKSAGRNILHGPGSFSGDASVYKIILTIERQQFQVRVEAFSVLNRANFGNPVSNLSDANFARILTSSGERVFQVGLKYLC